MNKNINNLLSLTSDPISCEEITTYPILFEKYGELGKELYNLLTLKNGFFAFESALHVFPFNSVEEDIGLEDWNSPSLWIDDYSDLINNDTLFFAEDIFGGQFCILDANVYLFDPETGDLEIIANSLDVWVSEILSDYNVWTGYPLAHEWQLKNGKINNNCRLIPKTPFVCGGEYDLNNLISIDAIKGMKSRANLAMQIKDLPDGSEIQFKIID